MPPLALHDFQQRALYVSLQKAFVLLSGRSSDTNDISPTACLVLIFRPYFGDEQDMAVNNVYGLNEMKNLVIL